jgi:hypothetical protein
VTVKLPMRLDLDPLSGQVTATIPGIPQLPFSDLELRFKGGPRGVLRMPPACGNYATGYELTSWADPRPLRGSSDFAIDRGCAVGGFDPGFSAGTVNPVAGAAAPFVLNLTREDGEENLSALSVTLPPGLTANFADVPLCPDAALAQGACPADSKVCSTARFATGRCPADSIYGWARAWSPVLDRPLAGPVYLRSSARRLPAQNNRTHNLRPRLRAACGSNRRAR